MERNAMTQLVDVRFTAIGAERSARDLENSRWQKAIAAKHVELFEFCDGRRVWWYQTSRLLPTRLHRLSTRWPTLTLIFEYDDRSHRAKGLINAVGGVIDHCRISYPRYERRQC